MLHFSIIFFHKGMDQIGYHLTAPKCTAAIFPHLAPHGFHADPTYGARTLTHQSLTHLSLHHSNPGQPPATGLLLVGSGVDLHGKERAL